MAPAGRETTITANVTASYDSNDAGSDAQLAALRGLKLADQLVQPEADFVIARNVGAQILFLQGNAGYVFHRVNTILDRQSVDVEGGVNARYARCQEVGTAEYSSFQTDLTQTVLATQVVKNTQDVETFGGTVTCGRSIGFAPSIAVTEALRHNSAAIEQTVDSNTFTVSPSIAYQQPALGAAAIFASYSDANFPHEIVAGARGGVMGGYTYYAGGIRFSHNVGARISASGSVSYTKLDQKLAGLPGFSGLTYSADVSYVVTTRLSVHADASRATTPSLLPGANYSVSETYEAGVSYLLGPRLTLTLGESYQVRNYPSQPGVGLLEATNFNINQVTFRGSYQLNRRWTASLFVDESNRNTNFPGESFSRVLTGLSVTATL